MLFRLLTFLLLLLSFTSFAQTDDEFFNAIIYKDTVKLKQILDKGYNVNVPNKKMQMLPLYYTVLLNDKTATQLLIKKGADVNVIVNEAARHTLLHFAVNAGKKDVVEILINNKAKLNTQDAFGETPLHGAVHTDNIECAELLLKAKADLNLKDIYGNTPLMKAAEMNKLAFCRLLLQYKADLNITNTAGQKAVDIAVANNYSDIINLLSNPDSGVVDNKALATESLFTSVKKADTLGIKNALQNGADINAKDHAGFPVIYWATAVSSPEIIKLIISKGANVNLKNIAGESALHLAAGHAVPEITLILIKAGINLNSRDNEGKTPLMEAAARDRLAICRILFENKADFSIKDNEGNTALDLARKANLPVIAAFLSDPVAFRDDPLWLITHVLTQQHIQSIDFNKKTDSLNAVLEIQKSKQDEIYLRTLINAGRHFTEQGHYKRASQLWENARTVSASLKGKNSSEYLEVSIGYADLLLVSGDYIAASTICNEILKTPGKENNTQALIIKGTSALETADLKTASLLFEKASKAFPDEKSKWDPLYGELMEKKGFFALYSGKMDEANTFFIASIQGRMNAYGPQHRLTAQAWENLGTMYKMNGFLLMGEVYFMKALGMRMEQTGIQHPDFAKSLNNIAEMYLLKGEYGPAEVLLNKVKEIYSGGSGNIESVKAYIYLGKVYQAVGNFNLSKENYTIGLEKLNKIGASKHPMASEALASLALLNIRAGNFSESSTQLKNGLDLVRQNQGDKSREYAAFLNLKAMVHILKGELSQAEIDLKKALEIISAISIMGQNDPAYAEYLLNLAIVYHSQGKYEEPRLMYMQGIAIRKASLNQNHKDNALALMNMARLELSKSKESEGEKLMKEALEIYLFQIQHTFPVLSEKEKEQFYNSLKTDFNFFNAYVVKHYQTKPELAAVIFDLQLSTKALILNSTIRVRDNINSSGDTSLVKKFNEWKQLREIVFSDIAKTTKDSIERRMNVLEKELSLKSLDFADAYLYERPTWQMVQKKLKPGEAAIEIVRIEHDDSTDYLGVLLKWNSSQPEFVYIPSGSDLEIKFYNYYRNSIQAKTKDQYSYEKYWSPIKNKLSGVTKLYFSPDGIYNKINLNTLRNATSEKYLIDEIEIHFITNSKELIDTQAESTKASKSYFFGRPAYRLGKKTNNNNQDDDRSVDENVRDYIRNIEFADLPGTEKEVMTITEILKSNNWQYSIYTGADAGENKIKNIQNPKVLHIATHGFFITSTDTSSKTKSRAAELIKPIFRNYKPDPLLRSGVVLAGVNDAADSSGGNDGVLTAYEVMNLNLEKTDLIVLSACETGLGEVKNGEGVYGLQRAFNVAGANTIIMSLWKVNDDATQELMQLFYTEWIKSGDKRQAFRKAQQKLREKYPAPYYWGAFVIQGK